MVFPSLTDPACRKTPANANMHSVTVVFPASTWAKIPILQTWVNRQILVLAYWNKHLQSPRLLPMKTCIKVHVTIVYLLWVGNDRMHCDEPFSRIMVPILQEVCRSKWRFCAMVNDERTREEEENEETRTRKRIWDKLAWNTQFCMTFAFLPRESEAHSIRPKIARKIAQNLVVAWVKKI